MAPAKDIKERLQLLLEDSRKSLSSAEVTPLVDCCFTLLKDSDIGVSEVVLQALGSAIVLAGEHLEHLLTRLVPAVVERLGDGKRAVRKAARELLTTLMQVSSPTSIVERAGSHACIHESWRVKKGFARSVTSAISLYASMGVHLQRVILALILPMLEKPEVREAAFLCIEEMYRQGWSQELQQHHISDMEERIESQQLSASSVNPGKSSLSGKKRKLIGGNVDNSKNQKASKSEHALKYELYWQGWSKNLQQHQISSETVECITGRLKLIEPQQFSASSVNPGNSSPSGKKRKLMGENVDKSKNQKASKSEDTLKYV